jgi:hypothetical protein
MAMQTWNPNDQGTTHTLSNGNLTVTYGGVWPAIRALIPIAAGEKKYFEIVQDVLAGSYGPMFGVMTAAASLNNYPGSSHEGWSLYHINTWAEAYHGGSRRAGSWQNSGQGAVNMVAVDLVNNMIWFGSNGVWYDSGDPANASNPMYSDVDRADLYPTICMGDSTNVITVHFDPASFVYAAPAGFSGWSVGGGNAFRPRMILI